MPIKVYLNKFLWLFQTGEATTLKGTVWLAMSGVGLLPSPGGQPERQLAPR